MLSKKLNRVSIYQCTLRYGEGGYYWLHRNELLIMVRYASFPKTVQGWPGCHPSDSKSGISSCEISEKMCFSIMDIYQSHFQEQLKDD